MGGRGRLVAGVVAVAVAGGLAWWWLRDGSGPSGDQAGAGTSSSSRGATRMNAQAGRGPLRWLGQLGLAPRRIAGRVTHAGAPVAGATVRLELPRELHSALPPVTVTTAPDGRFDFGTQMAAEFLVMASAPARAPDGARVDLRDPTRSPPPDRLELALADCAQTVHGTIHDHGGPIAEASVRVMTHEESIAIGTTGEDGRYELCVGPGGGRMRVAADGYASVELEVASAKRLRRDVELAPEALLSGIVLGPDGQPVAGAFVHVSTTEMNPLARGGASGVTGEDGRFSLGGLPPGRYTLGARDQGQRTAESVEAVASVAGGEDITLRLVAMVTVRGRIVEDGKPVAGARIAQRTGRFLRAGRSFAPHAQAVSQPDGSFVLDAVPPGTFAIAVDEYDVIAPHTAEAVSPETEVTVEVASKARVSGRVTRDGKPVAGATVSMMGANRSWGGSAKTKADGVYEIGGLDAGSYELDSQSDGAFARDRTLEVGKGQRMTGVDIELDLAGEIAGLVVDQNGKPVAGVAVVFEMGPRVDWGFATTQEDGTFVAGAMSGGGSYSVTVKPERRSQIELQPAPGTSFPTVSLTDGRSRAEGIRIAVLLERKQITGVVVGADGKPAADIKVSAFTAGESGLRLRFSQPAAEVMTGADGGFLLRDLAAGDYSVRARAASGGEIIEEKVPAGRSDLRLRLPGVGAIHGRLVGFTDKARVSALRVPLDRYSGRVRGDRFTIEGLPPDAYVVSARDGGRADESPVVVEAGKTVSVTLTSEGTATVWGRVVNLATREPLAGIECDIALGRDDGDAGAVSGAGGDFRLVVPAGRLHRIRCAGPVGAGRAIGSAEVDVAQGARREVLVEAVVTRRPWGQKGDVGLMIVPGPPARVYRVTAGGPAERAGVKVGDAILKVDGVAVDRLESAPVLLLVNDHAVGEKVELVLGRDGREIAVSVEVVGRKR